MLGAERHPTYRAVAHGTHAVAVAVWERYPWYGMDGEDLGTLVRKRPFEPLEIGLSDGRSVLVRHPDQVVISRRKVIFGLGQVRRPPGH